MPLIHTDHLEKCLNKVAACKAARDQAYDGYRSLTDEQKTEQQPEMLNLLDKVDREYDWACVDLVSRLQSVIEFPTVYPTGVEPPCASKHNPDAAYLAGLVKRSGLSPRKAAEAIGIGERLMRYYLTPAGEGDFRLAPYPVQYALECLAAAAEEPKS